MSLSVWVHTGEMESYGGRTEGGPKPARVESPSSPSHQPGFLETFTGMLKMIMLSTNCPSLKKPLRWGPYLFPWDTAARISLAQRRPWVHVWEGCSRCCVLPPHRGRCDLEHLAVVFYIKWVQSLAFPPFLSLALWIVAAHLNCPPPLPASSLEVEDVGRVRAVGTGTSQKGGGAWWGELNKDPMMRLWEPGEQLRAQVNLRWWPWACGPLESDSLSGLCLTYFS